LKRLL